MKIRARSGRRSPAHAGAAGCCTGRARPDAARTSHEARGNRAGTPHPSGFRENVPACGAVGGGTGARLDVLARRSACLSSQALLDTGVSLEADERLVNSFAQRYVHSGAPTYAANVAAVGSRTGRFPLSPEPRRAKCAVLGMRTCSGRTAPPAAEQVDEGGE